MKQHHMVIILYDTQQDNTYLLFELKMIEKTKWLSVEKRKENQEHRAVHNIKLKTAEKQAYLCFEIIIGNNNKRQTFDDSQYPLSLAACIELIRWYPRSLILKFYKDPS